MSRPERFTILLAGDCHPTERLRHAVAGSRCIAADAGMRHAAALGLRPELWVGDFDSADPAMSHAAGPVPRDAYSAAKDRTDGEIAIRRAIERGADHLIIAGAFGGPRFDHALGTAALASSLPIEAVLTDGHQWGHPLRAGVELLLGSTPDATLSIVGFTALKGLSLRGTRWTLSDADVPFGASLTLGNEIGSKGTARISLRDGVALAIVTPGRADGVTGSTQRSAIVGAPSVNTLTKR